MTGIEFLGIVAAAAFHSYVKFFGVSRVFRWYPTCRFVALMSQIMYTLPRENTD